MLEASAPWISAPNVILMHHAARAFQVRMEDVYRVNLNATSPLILLLQPRDI